jgi:hypothetical protein
MAAQSSIFVEIERGFERAGIIADRPQSQYELIVNCKLTGCKSGLVFPQATPEMFFEA